MAAPPPPPRGGMSLYANLLDSKAGDGPASISRAPVVFKQAGDADGADTKKTMDSSLRFQPIRRPQPPKPKPKSSFPKAIPASNTANTPAASTVASAAPQQQRSTIADWAATDGHEDYAYDAGAKRQRGGRKAAKKKKNRGGDEEPAETNWDELYDPARPTNVDEYLRSDERIREIREWKAVLYAHRRARRRSSDSDSDDNSGHGGAQVNNQFAPPGAFAPPASYANIPPPPASPSRRDSPAPPPPPPPPTDDTTGDDAFARRQAMSVQVPPPPPPPPEESAGSSISRAPVRYEQPQFPPPNTAGNYDEEMDVDDVEPPTLGLGAAAPEASSADAPRSSRPGQSGFASRFMSKYGWSKGQGLGTDGTGIANPLRVQVEKRKKKSDAEGGGWAAPGGRGKIIGGKRKEAPAHEGDKGTMSQVIVLRRMLDGIEDLEAEAEDGLGQEIGEECGDKYGRVERLYIDIEGRQVFIKFTDHVSAMRAIDALDGRIFNGNAIAPMFYDLDKFEQGIYR